MIKFNTYTRFHEFLSWSSQQLVLSSNFEGGIPPWLDSSYFTDNGDGTVSGNPSFYSPELVSNGDFSATSLGAEQASGNLTAGHYYEITAHDSVDFTADGAPDNNVGTRFVATGTSVTLDAGDKVKEVSWDGWTVDYQNTDSFFIPGESGGLRLVSDGSQPLYMQTAITVVPGSIQKLVANCTIVAGDGKLNLYDQTNSVEFLSSTDMGWSSGDNSYYFVVPDGCTSVRIRIFREAYTANDITYHSISITQQSLDATNLISNGGFETAGAGGADVFGSWAEDVISSGGAIADDTSNAHYGGHSAKITAGTSKIERINQTITVVPLRSYSYKFWHRGDGTYRGRFYLFDRINTVTFLPETLVGTTAAEYVAVTGVFSAPAGCTSVSVGLKCPSTEGGSAWFDDVEVREVLDGAELLSDPDFDDAGAWGADAGAAVADGVATWDGTQEAADVLQNTSPITNAIYVFSRYVDAISAANLLFRATTLIGSSGETGKINAFANGGQLTTSFGIRTSSTNTATVSYFSARRLILASTFTTARLPGAKKVRTTPTVSDSEWAGAVMCLDDRDNPANFVVAFIDAGNSNKVSLWSVASGVWTEEIAATSITYSAGSELEIRRVNDVFSVYYNGSQVGTSQTITGMTGNYHGLFATGSESSFGSLEVKQ